MENTKTYLENMTSAELEKLLEENNKLYWELRDGADESETQWTLDDLFKDCPRVLGEDSYNRLFIKGRYNWEELRDFCEWVEMVNNERYCIYNLDTAALDKIISKLYVLRDDDWGDIHVKEKDREALEKAVDDTVSAAVKALQEEYDEIRNQFDDIAYLVDMLFSTGWLEDSGYYVEGGKVYREVTRRIA